MTARTKIEWADSTFNGWEGCTKVGPGCDHCYAENRNARFAGGTAENWGPGAPRRHTSKANWHKPIQWNAQPFLACPCGMWRGTMKDFGSHWECAVYLEKGLLPARRRVFCASLADVFDNEAPAEWRDELWELIAKTPNLDWLLLTKRIGNVARMVPLGWLDSSHPGSWPTNVWLGITVVNQQEADRDVFRLLNLPAPIRFLSMEPLLGSVNLRHLPLPDGRGHFDALNRGKKNDINTRVSWVIVGGESGAKARPMHPDWVRSLRDQCTDAGVPFLFKQWGEWVSADCLSIEGTVKAYRGRTHFEMLDQGEFWQHGSEKAKGPPHFSCNHSIRAGKKLAGNILDNRVHLEWPA